VEGVNKVGVEAELGGLEEVVEQNPGLVHLVIVFVQIVVIKCLTELVNAVWICLAQNVEQKWCVSKNKNNTKDKNYKISWKIVKHER